MKNNIILSAWTIGFVVVFASAFQNALSQALFDNVSTNESTLSCYFSNSGMTFLSPNPNDVGLVYPRNSGHSYACGAGFWLGAKKVWTFNYEEYWVPLVLKSFDPASVWSMCVPGEWSNGNRYVPELADKYAVSRILSTSQEQLSASFHDGDLRYARVEPDTAQLKAMLLPLGFQFRQRLTTFKTSGLENCAVLETTAKYVGEVDLDSAIFSFVIDLCIGPKNSGRVSDDLDFCTVINGDDPNPIVICKSEPHDGEDFGSMGLCILNASGGRSTDGIQIGDRSGLFSGTYEQTGDYMVMSLGRVTKDTLVSGDRVVMLSVRIGRLVRGDSFSVSVGFVTTLPNAPNAEQAIADQMERLRNLPTSVDGTVKDSREYSRAGIAISRGNLMLDESYNDVTKVEVFSSLGERYIMPVHHRELQLMTVPPGVYVVRNLDRPGKATLINLLPN